MSSAYNKENTYTTPASNTTTANLNTTYTKTGSGGGDGGSSTDSYEMTPV